MLTEQEDQFQGLAEKLGAILADQRADKEELIAGFLEMLGRGMQVSRACYNEKQGNDFVTALEWTAEGFKPSLGQKLPNRFMQALVTGDIHYFTRETAARLLPKELKFIAGTVLSVLEFLQNISAIIAAPLYVDGQMTAVVSMDICREHREYKDWSQEQLDFVARMVRELGEELERRHWYTPVKVEPKLALLVLDLVQSTNLVLDFGDDLFINQIDLFHKAFMEHPSSKELVFIKNTGDGFLVVYRSAPEAYDVAWYFLNNNPIEDSRLRIGLHWGSVKSGVGGDPLGVEVHRVFRIEGVSRNERVFASGFRRLPSHGRIMATDHFYELLTTEQRKQFHRAGRFRLKGFAEPCPLWIAINKEDDE